MNDMSDKTIHAEKMAAFKARAEAAKKDVDAAIESKMADFELECAEYEALVQEGFREALNEGISPHKLVIIRGVPGVPPMLFRAPDNALYSWFLRDGVLDTKKSLTPEQIDTLIAKCARVPDTKSILSVLNERNAVCKLEIANMMLGYMRKMRAEEGKELGSL